MWLMTGGTSSSGRRPWPADFAAEQRFLSPLPGEGFDTGTVLWPRADKFARISVGKCRYSVPARLIGVPGPDPADRQ